MKIKIDVMAKKKQLKQSDTITINRSNIKLNPYNPKRHTDKAIDKQKRNLQSVGFLGGVTWNMTTGNLIDGHRRVMAMDSYYGYDGKGDTDYSLKVEVVQLDEKQEKEQMTYMAAGNTKVSYDLIAEYLPDIDVVLAGLDDYDISQIESYLPVDEGSPADDLLDDLISEESQPVEESGEVYEDRKAAVKESKETARLAAVERQKDIEAYLTISFENNAQKEALCEILGIDTGCKFVKGEKILKLLD